MRVFCLIALFSLPTGCVWVGDSDWEARVDADGDGAFALHLGGTDCDDSNAEVRPGAVEVCNGIDDNCDDDVDGGLVRLRYLIDADGDGFGSPSDELISCTEPSGYVQTDPGDPEDCDDARAEVHPGADDVWYDGVDSNCDGANDFDQDQDGYANTASGGEDCDDLDPERSPDADEIWYDGVDQDCDGESDFDQDGDGVEEDEDCDDTNSTIFPGADEIWYDGINQNCDEGSDYDQDGDGAEAVQGFGSDCDDTDASVFPGAEEVWYDGIDQDCDEADDFDRDGDGYQSDQYGGTDCDDTTDNVGPDEGETCNERDDDCNGLVDDIDTYWRDADGDGKGINTDTIMGCVVPDGYVEEGRLADVDCDDADPLTYPGAPAVCGDWVDNDCGDDPELCDELRPIWPRLETNGSSFGQLVGSPGDFNSDGVRDLWVAGVSRENQVGSAHSVLRGYAGPFEDGTWPEASWELSGDGTVLDTQMLELSAVGLSVAGNSRGHVLLFQGPVAPFDLGDEGQDGVLWLIDTASVPGGSHSLADVASEERLLPYESHDLLEVTPVVSGRDTDRWFAGGADGKFALMSGWPSSPSLWDDALMSGLWDLPDDRPVSFLTGAAADDVDGDGVEDFVAGASFYNGPFDGALLLTLGPLPDQLVLPLTHDALLTDPTGVESIGATFCLLDILGDGRLEVLDGGDNGPREGARAYVGAFEVGSPGPIGDVMTVEVPFNPTSTQVTVSCPGDLNGDGVEDFMLGSPRHRSDGGVAAAFFGPPVQPEVNLTQRTDLADLVVIGDTGDVKLIGGGIHAVGDMDGDGSDDVVVSEGSLLEGISALWLFRGKPL